MFEFDHLVNAVNSQDFVEDVALFLLEVVAGVLGHNVHGVLLTHGVGISVKSASPIGPWALLKVTVVHVDNNSDVSVLRIAVECRGRQCRHLCCRSPTLYTLLSSEDVQISQHGLLSI